MKFRKFLEMQMLKMDEAGDDQGGGGGGEDKGNKGNETVSRAEFDALIAQNKATNDMIQKLLGGQKKPEDEGDDLAIKAEKERAAKELEAQKARGIEKAMRFDLGLKDWTKNHEKMLPKSIAGIVEQADKETYGSTAEKVNAVKSGIVSEFFAIQSNLDLLTDAQKVELEDFKKLTKNEKQDRVSKIYDSIFEPTFENLKRIEKAKQVNKGFDDGGDAQSAYQQRMVEISRNRYLKN